MNFLNKFKIIGVSIWALNSCTGVNFHDWHFPYMMEVKQGNYVTSTQFKQLKLGMSQTEVINLLTTSISPYMFNPYSLQYIYQDYQNDQLIKKYQLNLYFDQQYRLIKIEKVGTLFENNFESQTLK